MELEVKETRIISTQSTEATHPQKTHPSINHSSFGHFLNNPILWQYAEWLGINSSVNVQYDPQFFDLDKYIAYEEASRKGALNEIFALDFLHQTAQGASVLSSQEACLTISPLFPEAKLEVDGFGFYALIEANWDRKTAPLPSPDGAIFTEGLQFVETTLCDKAAYFRRKAKQYVRLLQQIDQVSDCELAGQLSNPVCLFLIPKDSYRAKAKVIQEKIAQDPDCQYQGQQIVDFRPLSYTLAGFKEFFEDSFAISGLTLHPNRDNVLPFPQQSYTVISKPDRHFALPTNRFRYASWAQGSA